MKRIFFKFMALFAAITMIVGCEKDDLTPNREDGLQTLTLPTLSKETKADASITGNTIKGAWAVGDELTITGGNLGAGEQAIFVIKVAGDIAADGTAVFTAENNSTPYVDPESATDVTVIHTSGTIPTDGENNITIKGDASHIPFSLKYTGTLSNLLTAGGFAHQLPYLKLDAAFASAPTTPMMEVKLTDNSSNTHTYNLDLSDVISGSELSYSCFFALHNNTYTNIEVKVLDGATEISSNSKTLNTGDIAIGSLFDFPTTTTTYEITFNGNGSDGGSMTTQTVAEGVATAIKANSFTRTGYTFSGWNTAANGTGTAYANGANITLSADETLYAQWIEDAATTFDVTFDKNGGTGTMAAQTIEEGVATALTANSFTRTGYTFSGWNTAADATGTTYADGANITLSADVTLYAQWTAVTPTTYDVTFDANGGAGSMAAQTIEEGVATALTANNFTRTGYTFSSWNTAADGKGTSYADGADITLSADVTLYAQWVEATDPETLIIGYWEATALTGTYFDSPLTLETLKGLGIEPVAFTFNNDGTGKSPFSSGNATWIVSDDGTTVTITAGGIGATLTIDAISATEMTLSSTSLALGTYGTVTNVEIILAKTTAPSTDQEGDGLDDFTQGSW